MTYWPISAPSVYATSKQIRREATRTASSNSDARLPAGDQNGAVAENESGEESGDDARQESVDAPQDEPSSGRRSSSNSSIEKDSTEDGVQDVENALSSEILAIKSIRSGHIFATITSSSLTVWQTKPTAVLTCAIRSAESLDSYGDNVSLLVRPDSSVFVVETSYGFLLTYLLNVDNNVQVYKPQFTSPTGGYTRRHSFGGYRVEPGSEITAGAGEGGGFREVTLKFRMVIRIDAGIAKALALDDELIVATQKPAAIQCIRWTRDKNGDQTSTELLSHMPWLEKKINVVDLVFDRPMNLLTFVTSDGRAFAVQKQARGSDDDPAKSSESLFRGYPFHIPNSNSEFAIMAAINARFSLIAVGCAEGEIHVYTARDYSGNIPISHKLRPQSTTSDSGKLTCLTFSPDGCCLFAGFEKGWMTWSVYGKPLADSFVCDRILSQRNGEGWLLGVRDALWIGSGAQLLILGINDNRIWSMEMARSAVTGCLSSSNVSRPLLQTNTGFLIYRGYDIPDLDAISADMSLWHHVQIPSQYLAHQWPIRTAVISTDGRYVAVAGRRGLAHYSVTSGRWKVFDDPVAESEFIVRGGMFWYQHVLIAAVETTESHEIRVYSRELGLDRKRIMHVEILNAPIVVVAPTGEDSLLVYTYENILHHFVINVANGAVKLIRAGQIGLHGIIRSPPRVRAVSWILPEHQIHNGDPSQDVSVAAVLFLVDGKLVMLQPGTTEGAGLRYEMKIIGQNVEYYVLMRDNPSFDMHIKDDARTPETPSSPLNGLATHDLRDSLWFFDGEKVRMWSDVKSLFASSPELGKEMPPTVDIPVDFYPMSSLLSKGIAFGVEVELVQRRDVHFAFFRTITRTHLFVPPLLRHYLSQYDSATALHMSQYFVHLPYFPHALEILLHDVLDEEVDSQPAEEQAQLPITLSFLSHFPQYLDIVVQCTRKTEIRSWRTLFAHLPSPQELFEQSLREGYLKTAGGYLLVLHAFDEKGAKLDQLLRLLQQAKEAQDWDLCKELSRFLMALDESGATLVRALEIVGLRQPARNGRQATEGEKAEFDASGLEGNLRQAASQLAGVSIAQMSGNVNDTGPQAEGRG